MVDGGIGEYYFMFLYIDVFDFCYIVSNFLFKGLLGVLF